MKKLRRWHLYLGCFFTPLLFLYILSGFILTGWPAEQKGPEEAQTFVQKLYWVHKQQFYPTTPTSSPKSVSIKSVDVEKNLLTTVSPHNYSNGQPGTLPTFAPEGLEDGQEYFVHIVDPQTFTLHIDKSDAVTGKNTADITKSLDEGFKVFFKPPPTPSRGAGSYNTTGFKWLVYAMVFGVLATMALGVILAVRTVKQKWPVYLALSLGLLVPILLLWLGQLIASSQPILPSSNPGENSPSGENNQPPVQIPTSPPDKLPDLNNTVPTDLNSTEPIDPFGGNP